MPLSAIVEGDTSCSSSSDEEEEELDQEDEIGIGIWALGVYCGEAP